VEPAPATDLILGIETSCDETAAAVVHAGHTVLSNAIASQIASHAIYGGVVPEIASREHLRHIVPVVRQALEDARVSWNDISAIAVTEGPGLAGALLVGISYAKAMGFARNKPLIAVNHLEGHIHSALLAATQQHHQLPLPALALVVSGGHTHLFLVEGDAGAWRYHNVGRTVDDAAGEAFDKVARMLGLGYPGGPWISALAAHGDSRAVPFSFAQVKPKAHLRHKRRPAQSDGPDDAVYFSYSGIKTAVARYVELHGMAGSAAERHKALAANPTLSPDQMLPHCDQQALDLIASFQHAMVEDLVRKTMRSAERTGAATVLVSGGVAANAQLRIRFLEECVQHGVTLGFPAPGLSTDNAAMIAAAAWPKFLARDFAPPELSAQPSLAL
jgi:N6-L-threonylcarbamoyladenine synthase